MKKGLMKKIIATAVLGIMTMGLAGCGSSNDKNSLFAIIKLIYTINFSCPSYLLQISNRFSITSQLNSNCNSSIQTFIRR